MREATVESERASSFRCILNERESVDREINGALI